MATYKYIRDLWKKPKTNLSELWKQRLIEWRKEPVTIRIERPTRLDRARSLGYRAKQGILVIRQRLMRGGRQRENNLGGRRSKNQTRRKVVKKNYQQVAEERVATKYKNCEVLNSYLVAKDGKFYWYEVIVIDTKHPSIIKDAHLGNLAAPAHKRRVFRGLTSTARKSRGLRGKGKGYEKARPSMRANKRSLS